MASGTCGRCGFYSHMSSIDASGRVQYADRQIASFETTFTCDRCGRLMIGSVALSGLSMPPPAQWTAGHIDLWWKAVGERATEYVTWLPAPGRGKEFPDVPEHIAKAADEAHICYSVNAPMSAVLMARTVTEATAKEKGVTTGSLFAKIDKLHEDGVIMPFMRETAHTIRQFGNDMAHGDISIPVSLADAMAVLNFMDLLLEHVFQMPARLAALQNSMQARKDPVPEQG